MIELKGTLKERIDEAVRLVCTPVSEEEVTGFIALYEKTGVKLLPSAIEFYRKYGGFYRNSYIMLKDPKFNKEISLNCYDTKTDYYYSYAFDPKETEKDMLRRLDFAMDDIEMVRDYAGQEVCPIGEIGYYYPADVYIGEDSKLYCIFNWTEEIGVFNTPEEILESYLGNNPPIGVDKMPIKTIYDEEDKKKGIQEISDEEFDELIQRYDPEGIDYYILTTDKEYRRLSSHREAVEYAMKLACDRVIEDVKKAEEKLNKLFPELHKPLQYNIAKASAGMIDPKAFLYVPKLLSKDKLNNTIYDCDFKNDNHGGPIPYWYSFLEPPHRAGHYLPSDFETVNRALFPKGFDHLEVYEWSTDWSDYFDDGHEWWGANCWSVYDKEMKRFVVLFASATD